MKSLFTIAAMALGHIVVGQSDTIVLPTLEVEAVRATERTPITKTDLTPRDIAAVNTGRDVPFLLQWQPAMTQSSDAGAGFGYSYLRMRGMDQTHINVTLNGVPLNDAESHGVFWVNTPELGATANSIQIQRGVGTSTVGPGAFGGSISLEMGNPEEHASQTIYLGGGSYGSLRSTAVWHTGRLGASNKRGGYFTSMGRLSRIRSNGYVDRSGVEQNGYLLGLKYYEENATMRLVHFSGHERTQQAWWGIPEAKWRNDADGIEAHIANNWMDSTDAYNLRHSAPDRYNYYTYQNEVDDYRQSHWQLISNFRFTPKLSLNITSYLVFGKGYFEQWKADEDYADYGLDNYYVNGDTLYSTDLVRRRWLSNALFGNIFNLAYQTDNLNAVVGGAWSGYLGDHFGTLAWMQNNPLDGVYSQDYYDWLGDGNDYRSTYDYRYYQGFSDKQEMSGFAKAEYQQGDFIFYGDVQLRHVYYSMFGMDSDRNDLNDLDDQNYLFFNPKAGIDYQLNDHQRIYGSAAIANREPNRRDFIDHGANQPKPERLTDIELGYHGNWSKFRVDANIYSMELRDQLVPTGDINDVGALLRMNVDRSHRRGVEIATQWIPAQNWVLSANATYSDSRIASFEEVMIDNADYSEVRTVYTNTPMAMAPNVIANVMGQYRLGNFAFNLRMKHVGSQYLDNTGSSDRALDAYQVVDGQISYKFPNSELSLDIFNMTSSYYAPNGYTWGYYYAGSRTDENFVFPMAPANFMLNYRINL